MSGENAESTAPGAARNSHFARRFQMIQASCAPSGKRSKCDTAHARAIADAVQKAACCRPSVSSVANDGPGARRDQKIAPPMSRQTPSASHVGTCHIQAAVPAAEKRAEIGRAHV